jgi:hypothetical protein
LQSNADARCSGASALAPRYTESRSFAAKNPQTVENDRETFGRFLADFPFALRTVLVAWQCEHADCRSNKAF